MWRRTASLFQGVNLIRAEIQSPRRWMRLLLLAAGKHPRRRRRRAGIESRDLDLSGPLPLDDVNRRRGMGLDGGGDGHEPPAARRTSRYPWSGRAGSAWHRHRRRTSRTAPRWPWNKSAGGVEPNAWRRRWGERECLWSKRGREGGASSNGGGDWCPRVWNLGFRDLLDF